MLLDATFLSVSYFRKKPYLSFNRQKNYGSVDITIGKLRAKFYDSESKIKLEHIISFLRNLPPPHLLRGFVDTRQDYVVYGTIIAHLSLPVISSINGWKTSFIFSLLAFWEVCKTWRDRITSANNNKTQPAIQIHSENNFKIIVSFSPWCKNDEQRWIPTMVGSCSKISCHEPSSDLYFEQLSCSFPFELLVLQKPERIILIVNYYESFVRLHRFVLSLSLANSSDVGAEFSRWFKTRSRRQLCTILGFNAGRGWRQLFDA